MRIRRKDVNESDIEVLVSEVENATVVSVRAEAAADVEEELALFSDGDVADFDYSDEKSDSGEKKKRSAEKELEKTEEESDAAENVSAPFDDGEVFDELSEQEPIANAERGEQDGTLELDAIPITDDVPDGAIHEINEDPEQELERKLDRTEDTLNSTGDDDTDAEK